MRKHAFALLTVVAVLVTAMAFVLVNCGGGGGSPTEPPPNPTPPGPTPTPVPVTPSITFDAATPDCGSTLSVNQSVSIKIYAVVNPDRVYSAYATLYDAQGKTASTGGTNPEVGSTGYYYITKMTGGQPMTTSTMLLRLTESDGQDLNPPVTQTVTCGWTWK